LVRAAAAPAAVVAVAASHQVHVSPGRDATQVRVSWASATAATAAYVRPKRAADAAAFVRHGSAVVASYARAGSEYSVPQDIPDYVSPFLHSVVLEGLAPDGVPYEYYVSDDDDDDSSRRSPVFTFRTLPSTPAYPTSLVLLGDHGQTEFSAATVAEMLEWVNASTTAKDPAACLLVGDLSYADGDQRRWDSWERLVEPVFAELPLLTLAGNHETEATEDGDAFLAYRSRYRQPGEPEIVAPGTVVDYHTYTYNLTYEFGASYYAVSVGPARVVALNTYVDASVGSLQRAWLEREVACLDRQRTPWLVVSMHAPWYSTNVKHRVDDETATRQHKEGLEAIVAKAGAAIVFAGHVHAYERSRPVCFNEVHDDPPGAAPVYVTIGDGGNREQLYDVWPFARSEPWSAFRNGTKYGFGELEFVDDATAVWRWLPNSYGGPADEVTIVNPWVVFTTPDAREGVCDDPTPEYNSTADDGFVWDCDDADVVGEVQRRVAWIKNGGPPSSVAPKSSSSSKGGGGASEQTVRALTIVAIFFVATFIGLAALYSLRSAQPGTGRRPFAAVGGLELPAQAGSEDEDGKDDKTLLSRGDDLDAAGGSKALLV